MIKRAPKMVKKRLSGPEDCPESSVVFFFESLCRESSKTCFFFKVWSKIPKIPVAHESWLLFLISSCCCCCCRAGRRWTCFISFTRGHEPNHHHWTENFRSVAWGTQFFALNHLSWFGSGLLFDAMQNGRLHSEFDINVSIFHHKHHGATTNHVFMPEFQPDVVWPSILCLSSIEESTTRNPGESFTWIYLVFFLDPPGRSGNGTILLEFPNLGWPLIYRALPRAGWA